MPAGAGREGESDRDEREPDRVPTDRPNRFPREGDEEGRDRDGDRDRPERAATGSARSEEEGSRRHVHASRRTDKSLGTVAVRRTDS
ncbi:hypothetical protein DM2_1607 [Halorubrum sp. DM2]|nr:hypothetical protein DM2_1607 [Halorubrum sp. DM2]